MSATISITPSPWHSLARAARWSFCGLMVLGALWVVWDWYAGRALARELAAAKARGEPVALEDLEVTLGPGEENAAKLSVAAITALGLSAAETEMVDAPLRERDPTYPLNEADLATARGMMESQKTARDIIHRLRDVKNAAWYLDVNDIDASVREHRLGQQRRMINMLAIVAIAQHQSGEDGAAIETLQDMLALSDRVDQGPFLIDQLVAIACASKTAETLRTIAPDVLRASTTDAGGASAEQIGAIIGDLRDTAPSQLRMVRSLQAEGPEWLSLLWRADRQSHFLLRPVLRVAARRGLEFVTASARAAAAPNYPARNVLEPKVNDPTSTMEAVLNLFYYESSLSRVVALLDRNDIGRGVAATRLAMRCYELDHDGKIPAALSELVPRYLPAIPVDVFRADSGPMTYVPGRRLIYSVGENGKDEGGVFSATDRFPTWRAADIVFPLDNIVPPPPVTLRSAPLSGAAPVRR